MARKLPTPHMLFKRKSLNDDLIIWHGMAAQNLSVITAQGLPFSLRRRKIWLDIVAAEVEKKSKSIVAQVSASLQRVFWTRLTDSTRDVVWWAPELCLLDEAFGR